MPEAAMDKNGAFVFGQNDVRFAGQFFIARAVDSVSVAERV